MTLTALRMVVLPIYAAAICAFRCRKSSENIKKRSQKLLLLLPVYIGETTSYQYLHGREGKGREGRISPTSTGPIPHHFLRGDW
ncbi:hypothetical protein C8Q75DRAFT_498504 [Abortiporus biennis]|nr:hypothetical protein C8Q75DRAFT_498504 [Abortiporus biennis]